MSDDDAYKIAFLAVAVAMAYGILLIAESLMRRREVVVFLTAPKENGAKDDA